jgi:hypothetical protein
MDGSEEKSTDDWQTTGWRTTEAPAAKKRKTAPASDAKVPTKPDAKKVEDEDEDEVDEVEEEEDDKDEAPAKKAEPAAAKKAVAVEKEDEDDDWCHDKKKATSNLCYEQRRYDFARHEVLEEVLGLDMLEIQLYYSQSARFQWTWKVYLLLPSHQEHM